MGYGQMSASISKLVEDKFSRRRKIFFTLLFFFTPLFLYKVFLNLHIENNIVAFSLFTIIISIKSFCIWFNINKIGKEDKLKPHSTDISNFKNEISPSLEKDKDVLKLDELKLESNLTLFKDYIKSHNEFDFFIPETKQFELSSFSLNGRTILKQTHASFLLLVFFFEEVLKDKSYLSDLPAPYYLPLNEAFFNDNIDLDKSNWASFKKKYLKGMEIHELKSTEFYKELQLFHNKHQVK
ncbi:hypothetical protein B4Q04_11030 [Zobellia sp. OII3]|nr:hypothetical protein B4Q04_11030 [Zobellia sp. OII3]